MRNILDRITARYNTVTVTDEWDRPTGETALVPANAAAARLRDRALAAITFETSTDSTDW